LCGYVHTGDEPPDECPVCGAPQEDFSEEIPATAATVRPSQWRCLNCNYVHDGDAPPDECPLCGAIAECFEAVEPGKPSVQGGHSGDGETYVVLGAGIAGVSAVEAIRDLVPGSRIVLVNGEGTVPYYRLNLTRYLAGEIGQDAMPIHPAEWYEERRIELISGGRVQGIDREAKTVTLGSGEDIAYTRLVLTMGSHPFVPPLDGTNLDGVLSLRTSTDAEAILDRALWGPCVVIGGGVLGMETAAGLARRGADVTLLESHAWIMPRQLSEAAGGVIERQLASIGVKLRKEARTVALSGTADLQAVTLSDGIQLPARTVVLATGVRPNTHLARRAGLDVDRGVVVSPTLQTSDPDIYAAGDVAEHDGRVYGTWAISQFQGVIAGSNAAGGNMVFGNLPRSNTLKVLGLELLSVGDFVPVDGSYEVLSDADGERFAEFIFRDGQLVGAILIGHGPCHTGVKKAVEDGEGYASELASGLTACDLLDQFSR
jgi:nitrite reductase (NADH) large subunit